MNFSAAATDHYFEPQYAGFTHRPVNYKQTLWEVDDGELYNHGERFMAESSPFVEAVIEQGQGPLDSAPIPDGLIKFVEDFTRKFGVTPSRYSTTVAVLREALQYLDYMEPYFLLVDMPIQLRHNQLMYTYRHKRTGSVLNPQEIETFQVEPGWDFKPYKEAVAFLEHPVIKQVLRGEVVPGKDGKTATKSDVLDRISQYVWGSAGNLRAEAEEWLWRYYSDIPETCVTDDEIMAVEACQKHDLHFWSVVTLGCMLWFKSPHSLRYLLEYHPIYSSLLYWNPTAGKVELVPYSGGEAVVWGWDVYSHLHLVVEKNQPPGTCESCKSTLHCTKYINATALFYPVCSCGKPMDVEDSVQGLYEHGYGSDCKAYREAHPPFDAFVCQRCIQMAITDPHNKMRKCDRMSCPATQCPHHAGQAAYLAHITERRRMQLTHMTQ